MVVSNFTKKWTLAYFSKNDPWAPRSWSAKVLEQLDTRLNNYGLISRHTSINCVNNCTFIFTRHQPRLFLKALLVYIYNCTQVSFSRFTLGLVKKIPLAIISFLVFLYTKCMFFCVLQLDQASTGIIQPLDGFRKDQLGSAKVLHQLCAALTVLTSCQIKFSIFVYHWYIFHVFF